MATPGAHARPPRLSNEQLAKQLMECAVLVKKGERTPLISQTIHNLSEYLTASRPVDPHAERLATPAKQEEQSHPTVNQDSTVARHNKHAKTPHSFLKVLGLTGEVSHEPTKSDAAKKATSIKNAARVKAELGAAENDHGNAGKSTWFGGHSEEHEWCEEHFCMGCACKQRKNPQHLDDQSHRSSNSVTSTQSRPHRRRPPFQRPQNAKSTLIANGWIEQQRRSKMRTVWKEVLASVVEGRKAGEETTLWIQREVQNSTTGKLELEALHKIPVKWLQDVTFQQYSQDNKFVVKVYNLSEEFVFRCTTDEDAAQNWVLTLQSLREIAQGLNMPSKPPAEPRNAVEEWEEKKVPEQAYPQRPPAPSALQQNNAPGGRISVKELRAIAHGAGINTVGMERGELEAVVARIANGKTPVPDDAERHQREQQEEYERRKKLEEARARQLMEEEAAKRHAAAEEEAAKLRAAEEAARLHADEEEAAKLHAAEDEGMKRRAAEREALKRRAAEREAMKRRVAEEEAARRHAEEEASKLREEEARKLAAEEEARKLAAEEEARKTKEVEDEHRRIIAEKVRKQQEMERRKKEEEERQRLEAERLRKEEEEHQRRVAEQQAAEQRRRQEEAIRQQQQHWQQQQQQWQQQQAAEEQRRRIAEQKAAEERRRQEEAYRQQQWQKHAAQQQQWQQPQPPHQQWQQQQQHVPPHQQHGFPNQQYGNQQQAPPHQYPPPPHHYPHPPPEGSPVNMKYAKMAHQTENENQMSTQGIKHGVLVEWALQPPGLQVLRPIEVLITSIHKVFPPRFGVKRHEYFSKWRAVALSDVSLGPSEGNRLDDEKMKKAIKKLRFFLHPDKLPKDFSPEQSFVCKLLWDISHDAWEEHKTKQSDLSWMH